MTSEEAIKFLELEKESTKKCWDSVNHEGGREYFEKSLEVLDMAIKALEAQPNQCNNCIHLEEQDGSNCYECVKGIADNFEAQPKTSYISVDLNKFAKEVAETVLDEITYEGKTIRDWVEIIVNQQPSKDCISREEMLSLQTEYAEEMSATTFWKMRDDIRCLPSATPERPKGGWIKYISRFGVEYFQCSECGRRLDWIDRDDNYCSNCGSDNSESTKKWVKEWDTKVAEMSEGEENDKRNNN